ncbi:MAG: outer membrane protein transport protein [Comamonadaceae bacterium]|nr:outer membrane protein transport protein [Comamonadaceae bacterium]
MNINPSIAFRVNDMVSLGFGVELAEARSGILCAPGGGRVLLHARFHGQR